MFIESSKTLQVDCYVNEDCAGLWGVENDQDPTYVKSRARYLIDLMGSTLSWVSEPHTHIALSAIKSEYISLYQSMRDLISIKGAVPEISNFVFGGK